MYVMSLYVYCKCACLCVSICLVVCSQVKTSMPVKRIVTNEDGSIKHLEMRDGSTVVADEVSM